MIIYIHGFGGSGEGIKSNIFRKYFQELGISFISPSLSYIPDLAIQTLEELIESYMKLGQNVSLMGSSLGGYYSIYLAHKYNLKAILINPSTLPMNTLSNYIGYAPSFYDDSSFKWQDNHIEMLKKFQIQEITKPENFFLMLQKGDELLDYTIAVEYLDGCKMVVEEGGNHSFDGIQSYADEIKKFLIV